MDLYTGFRNKGFQDGWFDLQYILSKSVDVEADCGPNVRKSFFVRITLPHYNPLQSQWVSDVTISMFFNDNLISLYIIFFFAPNSL